MNKVKFVLLSAGISLALGFTFGCSSDDGGDNSGGGSGSININPQVYDGNDGTPYKGSGDIKISAEYEYTFIGKDTLINAGSVTNGVVNLKLPTIPNDEYLKRSSDLFIGERRSCTSYPKAVKYWRGKFHLYDNNGKDRNLSLFYAESNDNFELTYAEIRYMYFQENVKITCKEAGEREGSVELANIDAKKGWNVI